ncbi:ORF6C domain-containing protein [Bacillus paranthracis]|uniref:ORF6C domain-containing protein n=1 Tax=Bacillus TaxID=1386 RepID=UPI0007725F46|nr:MULTISPECIES: ORF6C domain-containing protein [Bacillus]KXI52415.1 Rha family transcriptional regulator [Bacillus cereus]MDA2769843.1 ORF6C domain-containing protein [Bacillus cereus group sp. Bc010]MDK7474953.1 ORF6C domain-containing protein [Bacillus paranthracis]MDO3374729.1 ORF6C domain-containing protein [Bacillus paranthracis]MED1447088.1 ORF6C domain-containing protein [Bacillus pacificus]
MNQLQVTKHPASNLVFMKENVVITDSLTLAEVLGKRHSDVLRDIRKHVEKLNEAGEIEFNQRNIAPVGYYDAKKEWRSKYDLTEDGFAMVMMSYTTIEAMKMKVKFLEEFKRMKEHIQKLQQQPKSVEDAIIYSMTELKQIKSRQDHTEEEMNKMKLLVDNELWLTEQHKGAVQRKVKQRVFELKKEGYDNASYQGIYGALKRHFGVAKYDKIPRKYYQNAMRFIAGWYPPERPNVLDDYVS